MNLDPITYMNKFFLIKRLKDRLYRPFRKVKLLYQKLVRGWSDADTWSLDVTTSEFLLPRLKRFKELKIGYPSCLNSEEEWDEILNKMIFSFQECKEDFCERVCNMTPEERKVREQRIQEGLDLFSKHFQSLWW